MPQTAFSGAPPSMARRILPWLTLVTVLVTGLVLAALYGADVTPHFAGTPS